MHSEEKLKTVLINKKNKYIRSDIIKLMQPFMKDLKKRYKLVSYVGSIRRKKIYVKDIDILIATVNVDINEIKNLLHKYKFNILYGGKTRIRFKTPQNIEGDLYIVHPKNWGTALLAYTGNKAFNIHMRLYAKNLNMHLNDYGIIKNNKLYHFTNEKDIFHFLNLNYVKPENRN